jgi:hypothetical protein
MVQKVLYRNLLQAVGIVAIFLFNAACNRRSRLKFMRRRARPSTAMILSPFTPNQSP